MQIQIGNKVFNSHGENVCIIMSKVEKKMLIKLLNEHEVKEHQLLEIKFINIVS